MIRSRAVVVHVEYGVLGLLGSGSRGSLFPLAVSPLEFLVEPVDTARRVDKFHRAREVGVALRANFDSDLGLRAASIERVAATAGDHAVLILGVNSVFHCNSAQAKD